MSTYTGGSISTGKLVVNGNITLDASGANAATVEAVEINCTTVTATTINSENFNFNTLSLDISGNLTVRGSTNLIGPVTTNSQTVTGDVTASGNITARTLNTTGGFSVDTIGNVVVQDNLTVQGTSNLKTIVSDSVDTKTLVTPAGFSVDSSGSLTVPNFANIHSLNVDEAINASNISTTGNIGVVENAYIGGNLYVDNGVTIGDTSNGLPAVTLISQGDVLGISGGILVNGPISTVDGFSVDGSGMIVPGDSILLGNLTVDGSSTELFGNLTVFGASDLLGPVNALSLKTPAGFTVDTSANVTAPTNAIVNSLYGNGTSAFTNSAVLNSRGTLGNEYIGGNAYVNNGVTFGDNQNGAGFTMMTERDLNSCVVMSLTYDTSGNTNSGLVYDSSATVYAKLPVFVNGQEFFIMLARA